MEELERERQGHQDILRRAEGLEQEQTEVAGVRQEAERLRQERQRLAEELERDREELARLEQELQQSQADLGRRKRASARNRGAASRTRRPWWRRLLLAVGVFLGILVTWFISLTVALNMLAT